MLKLGVVGIGGYASHVARNAIDAIGDGEPLKFVAACDPRADDQPLHRDFLAKSGVPIFKHFDEFLNLDLDAVWLPIPIDLHRPFTEQALAAGKAVIVEKPAAGTVEEVDSMIKARDRAGLAVMVGFQNLFDPQTWAVKQKILEGYIGQIKSASVIGCWPRGDDYYSRAAWAGRARHEGTWVLDSPLNNAMAHFVNLALFLLGETPAASATTTAVEAELFRAYPIEMYDTCCVRAKLNSGVSLVIGMTHACHKTTEPIVTLQGTRGTLRFLHESNRYEFRNNKNKLLQTFKNDIHPIRQIIQQVCLKMQGDPHACVASLENARSHTLLVNAVSEAATVTDVPLAEIEQVPAGRNGSSYRAIRGVEQLLRDCIHRDELASKIPGSTLVARSGSFALENYHSFAGLRTDQWLPINLPTYAAIAR